MRVCLALEPRADLFEELGATVQRLASASPEGMLLAFSSYGMPLDVGRRSGGGGLIIEGGGGGCGGGGGVVSYNRRVAWVRWGGGGVGDGSGVGAPNRGSINKRHPSGTPGCLGTPPFGNPEKHGPWGCHWKKMTPLLSKRKEGGARGVVEL